MSTPLMQQVAVTAERGGGVLVASGGVWLWLAEHQQAIGALCALGGLVVALAGFFVHWAYLHRGSKEKKRRGDE